MAVVDAMTFGFTYIERNENGAVENPNLTQFASLEECCTAAEKAAADAGSQVRGRVDVVACDYDGERCHPQLMFVLKTFRKGANPPAPQ